MKKHLIYTGMFLAAIGFSACNEDFKDWADPQSNPQEESAVQLPATFTASRQGRQHRHGRGHSRFRRNCKVKLDHSRRGQ